MCYKNAGFFRKTMDHCEEQSYLSEENPNFSTSEDRSMKTIIFKVGSFTSLLIFYHSFKYPRVLVYDFEVLRMYDDAFCLL